MFSFPPAITVTEFCISLGIFPPSSPARDGTLEVPRTYSGSTPGGWRAPETLVNRAEKSHCSGILGSPEFKQLTGDLSPASWTGSAMSYNVGHIGAGI